VTFPAFKAGDSALRGSNGGFDFHTPPPDQSRRKVKIRTLGNHKDAAPRITSSSYEGQYMNDILTRYLIN